MTALLRAALVIPALNEEETIAAVVREACSAFDGEVIVVDNGSTDGTAQAARSAGVRVVSTAAPGYGRACATGAAAAEFVDVIVFMDGDGSDIGTDIPRLLAAIEQGADLVLGVRRGAGVEPGSVAPAARFGNWLAGVLLALRYRRRLHDLSPLKAIRRSALERLALREMTYGWTVEMLARSLQHGLRIAEVDTGYRRRAGGTSKVSGDARASVRAGVRILATIARIAVAGARSRGASGDVR